MSNAAAAAVDPLQALQAALTVPHDSAEQAELLSVLRDSLEAHPGPIPILCTTLIKVIPGAGDSLLKRWVLDLLHFAMSRSSLSLDVRTQLAGQALETLAGLLNDPNPVTVKMVIQCLTSVYPLLFRTLCTNRTLRQPWDVLSQCKSRILELVWSPDASIGVKHCAVKFMQRVILVQTRGVSDPRLQNKNDPNISFCPVDHPFISIAQLEAEGQKLLEGVMTILYTSQIPDLISAVVNSWSPLAKIRPTLQPLIVAALKTWTPASLTSLPASSVKSVEKAVRILLVHISRISTDASQTRQIGDALAQQALRMEKAAAEEKKRKALASDAKKKSRQSLSAELPSDSKRLKTDSENAPSTSSAAFLAAFDFTSLPPALITELIVANLQAFTEPELVALVQAYRERRDPTATATAPPQAVPTPEPAAKPASWPLPTPTPIVEPASQEIKDEPIDPLQMDMDEELEYEPDRLNDNLSANESALEDVMVLEGVDAGEMDLQPIDFRIPAPKELSDPDRMKLVRNAITRMREGVEEGGVEGKAAVDQSSGVGSLTNLWTLLLVRMVTRTTHPSYESDESDMQTDTSPLSEIEFYSRQDQLRQGLCDYIMADFPSRVRLATTWMNEEWYNDQVTIEKDDDARLNYDTWLNQIVATYQTVLDSKDKAFSRFLLDLPALPSDVFNLLRDLCLDPERMQAGFMTLREFVSQRPSLRTKALTVLLELTTHPVKITRGAAIITVKRWVPDVHPMDSMIREFALQVLRRLQKRLPTTNKDVEMNVDERDETMEDGQLPQEELLQTPYLPEELDLPAQKSQVVQHVELLFALSVKVPEFLAEIFAAFGEMEETVQEAVQDLITALIKSLGPNHAKLLNILRNCPPGAESLALRVLTIFTEQGRPSAQIVSLVKSLITERELDAKFLIPVIAEMDKADILRHLPRIVSILNGQPEPKNLVRSVFSSVVTTPPQSFGSVTSNLPRVRQSELLTPAELMVLLHESEKEIGLKATIEAIGICFSMTDVYRSEILAVVMQQIVDEPSLPVLFLRTVIQAVTTYKSLVGFVSTTLLSRLITKKIWTNPPLWEGFIRCAKVIAPASFGALLQLPKDQLRELVDKAPTLKAGLRDHVMKKAGNKARVAGLLDIFGEDENGSLLTPEPELLITTTIPV